MLYNPINMNFYEQYELRETIGQGGFAKVKLAFHRVTNQPVACKIIDKASVKDDLPRMFQEIDALKALYHPNICQLYQCYESDRHIYLILEYCKGGELFEYIVAKERIAEPEARIFFRQILSAVGYIHTQGFAHRDLKPENLLLCDDQHLKLTDFGLCAKPEGGLGTFLKTRCGSPSYIAPEILAGNPYLGEQCDVWSMGILLFTLVSGYLPYDEENAAVLLVRIQSKIVPYPPWISDDCKFVISRMLEIDASKRITIDQLTRNVWVCRNSSSMSKSKKIFGLFGALHNASSSCDKFENDTKSNNEPPEIDVNVVDLMSKLMCLPFRQVLGLVSQRAFDYMYSTYLILCNLKSQGVVTMTLSPLNSLTPVVMLMQGGVGGASAIGGKRTKDKNALNNTKKNEKTSRTRKEMRQLFGRLPVHVRSKMSDDWDEKPCYILIPSQGILNERHAQVRKSTHGLLPTIPKDRQMLHCTCYERRCLYMPIGPQHEKLAQFEPLSTPQAHKRAYDLISDTNTEPNRKRFNPADELACRPSKRILLSQPNKKRKDKKITGTYPMPDWVFRTPKKNTNPLFRSFEGDGGNSVSSGFTSANQAVTTMNDDFLNSTTLSSSSSSNRPNVLSNIERRMFAGWQALMNPIRQRRKQNQPTFPKMNSHSIDVFVTNSTCSAKLVLAIENVLYTLGTAVQFNRCGYSFRIWANDLICRLQVVQVRQTSQQIKNKVSPLKSECKEQCQLLLDQALTVRFGVKRKRISGNIFLYKGFTVSIMERIKCVT